VGTLPGREAGGGRGAPSDPVLRPCRPGGARLDKDGSPDRDAPALVHCVQVTVIPVADEPLHDGLNGIMHPAIAAASLALGH
jgi:hypothetical protein